MATVYEIYQAIDSFAPFCLAQDYDNVGILLGDKNRQVEKALVALDLTHEVIDQAQSLGAQLVVTHHPILFQGTKQLLAGSVEYRMVQAGIAHIAAHTNFDEASGGVNACLANACGLKQSKLLEVSQVIDGKAYGSGLIGQLEGTMTPDGYIAYIKTALGGINVRAIEGTKPVKTVAVNCGAGGFILHKAIAAGADALVTADLKYHDFLDCRDAGITVIDAGHFETEILAIGPLCEKLTQAVADVQFVQSSVRESAIRYY